jgi:hypothetical protein
VDDYAEKLVQKIISQKYTGIFLLEFCVYLRPVAEENVDDIYVSIFFSYPFQLK